MSAAEELCERDLKRDENQVAKAWNRNDDQDGKSKKENERKKSVMKERDKLRNWDQGWEQTRVQIMGDSSLHVNWLNGRRKINDQRFRADTANGGPSGFISTYLQRFE